MNTILNIFENYIFSKTEMNSKYKKVLITNDFIDNDSSLQNLLSTVKSNLNEIF